MSNKTVSWPPWWPFAWKAAFFKSLFKYSCLHPHPPPRHPPPHTSLLSTLKPTPFGFVHYTCSLTAFLLFPLLSLAPLPSGYCQFVLYFNVSGYILLACLFCWLGSTYRWDHKVFVFHHLAYFSMDGNEKQRLLQGLCVGYSLCWDYSSPKYPHG